MRSRAKLSVILLATVASGCSSVLSRAMHEPHPVLPGHNHVYFGVSEGVKTVAASENAWLTRVLFSIDLPLTAVVDTLLIPVDLATAILKAALKDFDQLSEGRVDERTVVNEMLELMTFTLQAYEKKTKASSE